MKKKSRELGSLFAKARMIPKIATESAPVTSE